MQLDFPERARVSNRSDLPYTFQGRVDVYATPVGRGPRPEDRVLFVLAPYVEQSLNADRTALLADRVYRYSLKFIPDNLVNVVPARSPFYQVVEGLVMLKRELVSMTRYSADGTVEFVDDLQAPEAHYRVGQQEVVINDPTQDIRFESAPVFARVNKDTSLNLRRGPGTTYDILGSLTSATPLLVLGIGEDGWLYVTNGVERGFVSGNAAYTTIDATDDRGGLPLVDAQGNTIEEIPHPAPGVVEALSPVELGEDLTNGIKFTVEGHLVRIATNVPNFPIHDIGVERFVELLDWLGLTIEKDTLIQIRDMHYWLQGERIGESVVAYLRPDGSPGIKLLLPDDNGLEIVRTAYLSTTELDAYNNIITYTTDGRDRNRIGMVLFHILFGSLSVGEPQFRPANDIFQRIENRIPMQEILDFVDTLGYTYPPPQ